MTLVVVLQSYSLQEHIASSRWTTYQVTADKDAKLKLARLLHDSQTFNLRDSRGDMHSWPASPCQKLDQIRSPPCMVEKNNRLIEWCVGKDPLELCKLRLHEMCLAHED